MGLQMDEKTFQAALLETQVLYSSGEFAEELSIDNRLCLRRTITSGILRRY
jgi:hypothetical protein